jgi:hypothetical protein
VNIKSNNSKNVIPVARNKLTDVSYEPIAFIFAAKGYVCQAGSEKDSNSKEYFILHPEITE